MTIFVAIQNTYDSLEIALCKQSDVIAVERIDKRYASKMFISLLDDLLSSNSFSISDISFFVVNQGPGPFSTLRVVLASVNGLSFATKIPLIGIDGLDALCKQSYNSQYQFTIVMLNAFNRDVYFTIAKDQKIMNTGYEKIELFLDRIQSIIGNSSVQFVGNASQLYKDLIEQSFSKKVYFIEEKDKTCSTEQLALMGFEQWQQQQNLSDKLLPLYLKKHAAQIAQEKK